MSVVIMSSNNYYPEIDGLRTIAVLSVIIYHANINMLGISIFPGGFVGVDIFFVISGYLITKIILDQISKGNFSYTNFYDRRIRRLFPVFLTVVIITIPFSWLFLLPDQLINYSKQVISSILFT